MHCICLNIMKPPWCNPIHLGLSNNTSSAIWSVVVWEITKQNTYLP
jgi:hypothetical protein